VFFPILLQDKKTFFERISHKEHEGREEHKEAVGCSS